MRVALIACSVSLLALVPSAVQAVSSLHLSKAQQALVEKYKISPPDQAVLFGTPAKAPAATPIDQTFSKSTSADDAADADAKAIKLAPLCTDSWAFLFRDDFKDARTLGCKAAPSAQATGGKLTFTDDRVTNNASLNANGTFALTYTHFSKDNSGEGPYLYYNDFGGFAATNFTYNSNAALAKKNVNALQLGIVGEFDYDRLLGGQHVFRFTASDTHDSVASTDVGNLYFEWIPTYGPIGESREIGTSPIGSFFSPEIAVRYDRAIGPHETVAFSGGQQALRIGPEVNWLLFGMPKMALQRFTLRLEGDLDYEVFSSRLLPYASANLTYNLDDEGHLGLNAQYAKGSDPQLGTLDDKFTIGLTGKL